LQENEKSEVCPPGEGRGLRFFYDHAVFEGRLGLCIGVYAGHIILSNCPCLDDVSTKDALPEILEIKRGEATTGDKQ
jgi:hypothetical protein